MMVENDVKQSFIERFVTSPPAIATLLMAIFGQAMFSIYFQVVNNEQQAAGILANAGAVKELREAIYSMQTPLAQRVIKMEDKNDETLKSQIELTKRIDTIDIGGSRGLQIVISNQQRVMTQIDHISTQLSNDERKISEVENKVNSLFNVRMEEVNRTTARLEDQQKRIIEALDNLYSEVSKIPPVLRANPKR